MGFFDAIGSVFNPSNWIGDSGNGLLDLMDPGNTFHTGESTRRARQQFNLEYDIAKKNYEEQVRQFDKNYEMQKEAYEYQKSLNELQMEREDTATARRVADLKASGLSPTLAAGSAADTGALHAGTAPQRMPAQMTAPSDVKVQAAMFKEGLMKDRMQLATSLMGNIANISKTRAEVELLNAQTNQLNSITPVELKLKEQMLQFNDEFNPYRIADVISGIENRQADTYYKERQKFLLDSQILLNNDEHGMYALRQVGLALDNELKQTKLTLDNQMYIKNAISIELLRQEYRQKEDIFNFNKNFYNKNWGVPIDFNLSPWTSYFGVFDRTPPLPKSGSDKFNPWDKTPGSWNDFVKRQFEKATNFLKETGIYKSLIKIVSGQYSTGGPFDFTDK